MTARVWEVNPNTQRATLTLRKGLLKSKLPVLSQLKVGGLLSMQIDAHLAAPDATGWRDNELSEWSLPI